MNPFARLHPFILFVYYVGVLLIAMFLMQPIPLIITMCGGILFYALLVGWERLVKDVIYYLFVFLLISLTNPLFSHNGETILFFMNNNPVTLEAIVYGMVIATMIIGVMFWCKCYQLIMTTDKFLYLFGTMLPKVSLVLSMAIRFLPLMKRQMREVNKAQKVMGTDKKGGVVDRIGSGLRGFDATLTWGIENSLDTAASMQARGYGVTARTSYSLYQVRKKDGIFMGVFSLLIAIIVLGYRKGCFAFWYYPKLARLSWDWRIWVEYSSIALLMFLPAVITIKEKLRWNYLRSKI